MWLRSSTLLYAIYPALAFSIRRLKLSLVVVSMLRSKMRDEEYLALASDQENYLPSTQAMRHLPTYLTTQLHSREVDR